MQYRKLGDSGMYVSAMACGNWTTHGAQIGQDAATSCVFTALDLGITTFDCVRWPSFPRCAALPTWGRRGPTIVDPPGLVAGRAPRGRCAASRPDAECCAQLLLPS